jgi:alcohol dehydrogenase class IV
MECPAMMIERVFTFRMPQVTMGLGVRRQLPALISNYGRRVCVVSDPGVVGQPLVAEVIEGLRAAGLDVGVFSDVPSDPPLSAVRGCAAAARGMKADALLGIGGGSALDVAKVAAVLVVRDCPLESLFGTDQVPGRGVPTVLVPTTAGTGSEVTPIAIFSDEAANLKRGVVSDYLLAELAVVDPQFCLTLPPGPTAYTGMDALTHAIEGYANRFAVPLVDALALEAARLTALHLRRAVAEGSNEEARYGMSLASLLGGLCLRSVNTGAVHALAYPLGGRFHVPHGVANSLLLPHVMRFNAPVVADRYQRIAEVMGGSDAVTAVTELSQALGTNRRMREFGVEQRHLPEMAAAAMQGQRLLKINPREVTEADALLIYEQAW